MTTSVIPGTTLRWQQIGLLLLLALVYFAGAKLGGVTFHDPAMALAALALGWAIITPVLVLIAQRLNGRRPDVQHRVLAAVTE